MIEFVRGTLKSKSTSEAVVDAGGIGLSINITINCLEVLPETGAEALIPVHFQPREDSMTLYGFSGEEEKHVFRMLISVNGVGPRTALGMLSGAMSEGICSMLSSGDSARLSKLPGIGKKTAELLILKLKDKAAKFEAGKEKGETSAKENSGKSEAVSALVALGDRESNAAKAVSAVTAESPELTVEEIIKAAFAKII
ncbi:MAG: Holliday junction branch migration protein RuvA [Fibrobacterota bacterium]